MTSLNEYVWKFNNIGFFPSVTLFVESLSREFFSKLIAVRKSLFREIFSKFTISHFAKKKLSENPLLYKLSHNNSTDYKISTIFDFFYNYLKLFVLK